jgi:thioredoxin 1
VSVLEVTDENFEEVVLASELPVVVDFWADWCGPCKKISPLVEELAEEWVGKAVVVKVNVDEAAQTGLSQKIMSLPTVAVFKNGHRVIELTGAVNKATLKTVMESQF